MSIQKEYFGTLSDGTDCYIYKIKNINGVEAHVINEGASLQRLLVPDASGNKEDVVLGYEDLLSYTVNGPNLGATIGRHANRIKDAKVTIDGVTYELEKNDGNNSLHSGSVGYARVYHEAKEQSEEGKDTVTFSRMSPDMEHGLPGNLTYQVSYTLTDDNELIIHYEAECDKATVINMTNHSYFNLKGHDKGSALDHHLKINSDRITSCDEENVPDGGYIDVTDTPMDFREFKEIGKEIASDYEPLKSCRGYDHNYVLAGDGKELVLAAEVKEPVSGRHMQVYTNTPGMQLYTANFLEQEEGLTFKDGASYGQYDAVCLETQFYPNACNIKEFPSDIFKVGEKYDSTTIYKFI